MCDLCAETVAVSAGIVAIWGKLIVLHAKKFLAWLVMGWKEGL